MSTKLHRLEKPAGVTALAALFVGGAVLALTACADTDTHVVSAPPPPPPTTTYTAPTAVTTTTTTPTGQVVVPTTGTRTVTVTQTPPPLQSEQVTERPSDDSVWVPGYWLWKPNQYVWISGHWQTPPDGTSRWVAPYTEPAPDGNGYLYHEGHWE